MFDLDSISLLDQLGYRRRRTIAFVGRNRRIVYVVDDEIGVRISLATMIDSVGYDAEAFGQSEDLLAALADLQPGIILLDIQMPGRNGLEVLAELTRAGCDWPVIAMTAYGDIPTAVRAIKSGAYDFVEKPLAPEQLRSLLERAIIDWAGRENKHDTDEVARQRIGTLTPRERDVLQGLSEGKQNKLVAHDLGLSIRTVEMHRASMLARLRVKTVQEAVAMLVISRPK